MSAANDIAIVGMHCRFPGADSASTFWNNILQGVESLRSFSDEELARNGVSSNLLRDQNYIKSGFVLEDIDQFDADFFRLTAREAQILDPQHRMFLQCCWHALEHSGYVPETFPGRIGVYAGVFTSSYLLNLYSQPGLVESVGELAVRHGNEKDYLATRLSYKLNLRGPSVSVQTSCSTSLVAVHMGVQSLLAGECDMVMAGGVSVSAAQESGYLYQAGGLTSSDGHCRPFDAAASGTVFGNGLGVVVLRRLEDALADNDTIYAVIKGSAINNDGSDRVGFTAPSVAGQVEVIAEAMAMADVQADTIGMVEAHGTGTPLGDPIEIEALTQAWRSHTSDLGYCALGSVKSNIGHLGAASGVAGLIKAALALHHKVLAPTTNFSAPNPNIDFDNSPFYVNTRARTWTQAQNHPRRAAVSSFGMGGTNAHVILQEAPEAVSTATLASDELLVLSARSAQTLQQSIDSLRNHLEQHPALPMRDIAHTLRTGRRQFDYRLTLVASDVAQAIAQLIGQLIGQLSGQVGIAKKCLESVELAFVFPGQGAQYAGMCRGLLDTQPGFKQYFEQCRALIVALDSRLDPMQFLSADPSADVEALRQTESVQPALFAVEYALAKMLMTMGITPGAMLGHSVGEYVCATLAGVFTLEDAVRLVVARARLMQSAPPGRMLSVPLAESRLRRYVASVEGVAIAAVNHPEQCVLAGPELALAELEAALAQAGVTTRYLVTSHAFHCSLMDPILAAFEQEVARTVRNSPQRPYLSNLTGDWISAEQATSVQYWCEHLRQPVRFADGIEKLLAHPGRVLLEVGPGTSLTGLLQTHPGLPDTSRAIALSRHPRDKTDDTRRLLTAIGQLWTLGLALPDGLFANPKAHRIALPAYPFEQKQYWIERLYNSAPAAPVQQQLAAPAARLQSWQWASAPAHATGSLATGSLAPETGPVLWHYAGESEGQLANLFKAAAELRQSSAATSAQSRHVIFASSDAAIAALVPVASDLLNQNTTNPAKVTVLTQQAVNMDTTAQFSAAHLNLLSALDELKNRYPELVWQHLDVGMLPADPANAQRMAHTWVADAASNTTDACIAWRGPRRLQLQASHAQIEAIARPTPKTALIASAAPQFALSIALEVCAQQACKEIVLLLEPQFPSLDALAQSSPEGQVLLRSLAAQNARVQLAGMALQSGSLNALLEQNEPTDLLVLHMPDAALAMQYLDTLEQNPSFAQVNHIGCLLDSTCPTRPGWPLASHARLAARAAQLEASSMTTMAILIGSAAIGDSAALTALFNGSGLLWLTGTTKQQSAVATPAATAQAAATPAAGDASAMSGDVENVVASLWKSLFGVSTIEAADDFFALGGTSLVAIQLIAQVRSHFGVELSIESLFDDPTVRGVAKQINALTQGLAAQTDAELEELLRMSDDISIEELESALAQ